MDKNFAVKLECGAIVTLKVSMEVPDGYTVDIKGLSYDSNANVLRLAHFISCVAHPTKQEDKHE
jgi:hypothetical protein